MHAKRSLHTGFVSTFGLLLVWGGLLGAPGVARGQVPYETLHVSRMQHQDVTPLG